VKPNCSSCIDAVSAGEMLEQKLSDTSERGGSEKHYDVPQPGRMLSGIENVSGRSTPSHMLYDFQEPSQRCRANSCTNSRKQNGQPEAYGVRRLERRRNDVASCRWQGSGCSQFHGRLPSTATVGCETHPPFEIDITPKVMPRVYDIVSPLAAGKRKCSFCLPLNS
jgi:hypothetical protein